MKCEDFEFEYIAAPGEIAGDACEHLQGCATCQAFVEQESKFQERMISVINSKVPDGFRHSVRAHVLNNRPSFWTLPKASMAMAASLLMAVGVVTINQEQLGEQNFPIDRLVVEHLEHDGARSMKASHQLSGQQLARISEQFGVKLASFGNINFAEKCPIGDSYGLHMTYKYNGQLVTVIYMPELSPKELVQFNYAGLKGWIKPMKKGSFAVLGDKNLEIPGAEFAEETIEWL
ncbi:MAG: hypothetical protein COB22_02810 [Cycloclasticus sp.]|nr:MAG: hypothetical protein COB22_02810 [Cycloclasticus sp.]